MGGSSLAPEVITRTAGVDLTILDTTSPGQLLSALSDRLKTTAVIISSKSGSTVETDSHKRVYESAFRAAGIDPIDRIIVVTDPGSPLDVSARTEGYRVFNADPNVGGRYSALTAFGLVPSGLAGADIESLLDEASSVAGRIAIDHASNPALILGAAIAGTRPLRDKLALVADGTYIVGFADWAEQLVAESTGKSGTGLLPVVLDPDAPELSKDMADLQIVRLVESAKATEVVNEGDIEISGTLGAQVLVWETAVAVAGRLLRIDPFNQPDVESAKEATRGLLDNRPEPSPPDFAANGIEVRSPVVSLAESGTIEAAIETLVNLLPENGYLSIHAYLDRLRLAKASTLRDRLAARVNRPVTFGWGPRFLHSTGQFHKGGPAVGVFLQITADEPRDLDIPDRPFTFGQLIQAQAQGDAAVLTQHGRPVLTLNLTDSEKSLCALLSMLG
jgi:glucose-6-phosphate isomerase